MYCDRLQNLLLEQIIRADNGQFEDITTQSVFPTKESVEQF